MIDSYKHKGLRKQLVHTIKGKGIRNEAVLEAIGKIPRHLFMDSSFLEFAYQDKPFPIGSGQTISQPYTVAFQTELMEVKPKEKVLEIGTGSGYQTAVLAPLVRRHRSTGGGPGGPRSGRGPHPRTRPRCPTGGARGRGPAAGVRKVRAPRCGTDGRAVRTRRPEGRVFRALR